MTETAPVTKVARDLTAIEDLSTDLEEQAIAKSDHQLMPGGFAMVPLGPVADPELWSELVAFAELRHLADPRRFPYPEHLIDEDDQDHEPALQTLLFWSEAWRLERGYPLEGRRPTMRSEAAFIRNSLEWAWENEPHFEDLARDVNRARRGLESTLFAGTRVEHTRVPCVSSTCETKPNLIKLYGPRRVIGYRCRACGFEGVIHPDATHCPNRSCWSPMPPEPILHSTKRDDRYRCPGCRKYYKQDEFRDAYAKQLRSTGAERFVLKSDAIATLLTQGTSESTVHRWFEPHREEVDACERCRRKWPRQEFAACPFRRRQRDGLLGEPCGGELRKAWVGDAESVIESFCEIGSRKTYVWWPDVWRLHLAKASRDALRSA